MNHPCKISRRAASIRPSATLAVSNRASELRAAGKTVLNFSAGEPDFRPPQAVRERVARVALEEPAHYAPVAGTPALRDAVATRLSDYHGYAIERSGVLVSCGAKHALANLFLATLDPGDEVVIPAPYWVSYPDMVALAEGSAVVAKTDVATGYRITPETLRRAVGPKTRFLILNSPGNPTGSGYNAAEIRALGDVLVEVAPQAYIVCDDIYRDLVYDGYQHASAPKALRGVTDQIVLVDGVSKSYAMTGYRIGFLVAPPHLIAAAARIQSQMTSGATTVSQHAAQAALTDPSVAQDVEAMKVAFTRRRRLMLDGLAAAPGLRVNPPDGAFYAFADVSAHVGEGRSFSDDVGLATWLLEEKSVATVPGTPFGAPGHLRLSYATADDTIVDGCARVADALSGLPRGP